MGYKIEKEWFKKRGLNGVYVNINNPSFNWLTGRSLKFIECKALFRNERRTWKEKIKVSNMKWAEQQCKEVVEFFNETLRPGEAKREFVEIIIEDSEVAKYKDDMGFTGWLTDAGELLPCDFGEHGSLVQQMYEKPITPAEIKEFMIKSSWISLYDGCMERTSSYVNTECKLTERQIEWFTRFADKLESGQKVEVSRLFEKQGLEFMYC